MGWEATLIISWFYRLGISLADRFSAAGTDLADFVYLQLCWFWLLKVTMMALVDCIIFLDWLSHINRNVSIFNILSCCPELYAPDRSVCSQTCRPRTELWPRFPRLFLRVPCVVLPGNSTPDRPVYTWTDRSEYELWPSFIRDQLFELLAQTTAKSTGLVLDRSVWAWYGSISPDHGQTVRASLGPTGLSVVWFH